jgi:hypothetical protein
VVQKPAKSRATKASLVSATHMRTASEIRGKFHFGHGPLQKNHGEFLKINNGMGHANRITTLT